MNHQLIQYPTLEKAVREVFLNLKVRHDVAHSFAEGICQNSLRGIDSHGIRLFPTTPRRLKVVGSTGTRDMPLNSARRVRDSLTRIMLRVMPRVWRV